MARKHRNELLVGLTVFVSLACAVYIIILLGDWSQLTTPQKNITVKMPYQTGLKGLTAGSPIYLGGTKIGLVNDTGIELPDKQTNDSEIMVHFTMMFPERFPLKKDCILKADSNLLGGQSSLVIKSLGKTGDIVTNGQTIELAFESSLEDSMEMLGKEFDMNDPSSLLARIKTELNRENENSLLTQLAGTAVNLRLLTEQLKNKTSSADGSLVTKLDKAINKLNATLENVQQLVKENRSDIKETVTSLKTTAQAIEKDLPDILTKVKPTLTKIDGLMDNAKISLDNIKQASQTARDIFNVNRESIDETISNLHQISSNLKLTSEEVRRAPWKLLYEPTNKEIHFQNVVDATSSFVAAAENLNNTTIRINALLESAKQKPNQSSTLDHETLNKMLDELSNSFKKYKDAEKAFWKELK